ncbi:retrovirus-related pol polyprotein from transposon 297-like protein [Plakobranchus ocellatus]|uniref:Retrovirus-related pol polyprotein from transposon 297-like protein n=1 Tax=Plakobranchus ocellatus TaxID=259542 RepID=A0AAV4D0J4_9GAST|nr:retrovirus-related pol polyprotein from transposon 297-like protein [Plakobranchus ocellatus]
MNGLGAVLLQNDAPVAFASKSLTETEKRYANIERDLLAVVFGCERFHTYIYGKPVIIKSDHKPLQNIHQKHIAHAPPRLQRMLLRIQPYDCTILYKPGKEMVIADYLSRANPEEGNTIALEATIYAVHATDSKIEQIKTETKKDPELGPLLEQIIHGWPDNSNQVQKGLRRYWSIKDYLSVDDGLVLKGAAIVIPKTMREEILARIHDGHQGIQKSILKARDCVYWHGLQKDITEMVQSCIYCSEHSKSQRKEPLQPHEIPGRPWQKIAADLFEIDGQQFLMVADYYSKMPFVKSMAKITSNACIEYLKSIFAVHGIPDELITDNGRQFQKSFSAGEFKEHYLPESETPTLNLLTSSSLIDRQHTQKHYYDTHTKELPVLQVNSRVTVQDTTTGRWSPATVINHSGDPRSYIVQTDSGQILRRNRLRLRETQVPKDITASPRSSRGEEHHPPSSQIVNNADVTPTNTEPHGSGLGLPSTTKDDDLPGNNSGTNDSAPSSHTSRYGRAIVRPKQFSD